MANDLSEEGKDVTKTEATINDSPTNESAIVSQMTVESSPVVPKIRSSVQTAWQWFTESKQRIFSIIFLLVFIGLMIFLGVFEKDPTSLMLQIVFWFEAKTGLVGLYIGVGIISIFGNFVMFIPVLYAVVLMFVAVMDVSIPIFGLNAHVLVLGIAAGIGASIGQIVSWFVGRATREVVDERMEKQLRKTQKWVERGLVPLLIFIFAATPLPDEVFLLMIGLIGYSLGKTLLYCFMGKIVLTVSVSYLANVFSRTNVGEWILETLFNVTRNDLINRTVPQDSNVWTSIAIWIITATLLVLVTFFDWVEIADNIKAKRQKVAIELLFNSKVLTEAVTATSTNGRIELSMRGKPVTLSVENSQPVECFPEEAFWFFEDQLKSRKNVTIRKCLLDLRAIACRPISIALDLSELSQSTILSASEGNSRDLEKQLRLVQSPESTMSKGFLPSYGFLIENKSSIVQLIPTEIRDEVLASIEISNRKKRFLTRKNLETEFLLQIENQTVKLWAIGLGEGIMLQKISSIKAELILFYWTQLLLSVLDKDSNDEKGLRIYSLSSI